jgi:dethiobiotin synthetase
VIPDRLIVVVGTATDVGKTWVTAALIDELKNRAIAVAVRKPVQSFSPGERTDAEILAGASGETPDQVCPPHRGYERPMAPPMAARALGRAEFTITDLVDELRWPPAVDIGVVEGAGGVRSPLAADGDNVDLAAAVEPDLVVLVADAGLGALNLVRMSTDALAGYRTVVYLNRFHATDELHQSNRSWLQARMGLHVVTDVQGLLGALG